jgi:serine protease AprX
VSKIRRLSALAIALAVTAAAVPALADLASSGSPAAAPAPRVAPALAAQLEAHAAAAPGEAGRPGLTVFVHAATAETAAGAAQRAGLTVFDSFERIGVVAATGPAAAVRAVAAMSEVTQVEDDRPIEFFMETSHRATRGAEARTAFRNIPRHPAPVEAWKFQFERGPGPAYAGEVDGRGVTVAVIDGGVDGTHPMFVRDGVSKVRRNMKLVCMNHPPGISFGGGVPQNTCPADPHPFWLDMTARGNDTDTGSLGGHGTHVAGIVAGYDVEVDGDALHGAAPGAQLVSLSMGYSITIYGGVSAMEWVLHNHANPCEGCPPIKVINNSWGSSGSYNPESVMAKLQNELVGAGVTVVWAAGNSAGDGSSTTLNPEAQSPTAGILAVANYDDADSGTREGGLSDSSSRGKKGQVATYPDLSAPGTFITSACRPHLTICTDGDNYSAISGTSMASPHVAGIVAQLTQVKPAIKPWQVEDVLEDSAHRFGFGGPYEADDPARNDGVTSFDKGHGLVDATTAIARLLGVSDPTATANCVAGSPVLVDPSGDAQWFVVSTSRPSEPTLDVTSAVIAERRGLVFTMNILDLQANPPPGANGVAFSWAFKRGEELWDIRSSKSPTGETHRLIVTDADGAATTIAGLKGAFDVEADQVRVAIPGSALTGAGLAAPQPGQLLSEFAITTWRQEGAVLAGVDIASSGCAHVIGTGTAAIPTSFVEPPPPAQRGDADARLRSGQTFEDEGTPPGSTFMYSCSGPNDPQCVTYLLELSPSGGGGELELTLTSDVIGTTAEDFDAFVYDLDGNELGGTGNPQTVGESAVVSIPSSGLYYLVVQPYTATPESPYTITATLR